MIHGMTRSEALLSASTFVASSVSFLVLFSLVHGIAALPSCDGPGPPPAAADPPPGFSAMTLAGPEPEPAFVGVYAAKIVNVVDGDTVDADVYLPIKITARARIRLLGINCPETHGETKEAGLAAKEYTRSLIGNESVTVRATEADAFGRWLGTVWHDGAEVNALILSSGHAVPYRE